MTRSIDTARKSLNRTLSEAMLVQPLEYLADEHFRQRGLCVMLQAMADSGDVAEQDKDAVIRYFDWDFGLHLRDEVDGLFPMLRARATTEDAIEPLLDKLIEDHAHDECAGARIRTALAALPSAKSSDRARLDDITRDDCVRFVAAERRQLMLENAIVLPLARVRLGPADRQTLFTAMQARRRAGNASIRSSGPPSEGP